MAGQLTKNYANTSSYSPETARVLKSNAIWARFLQKQDEFKAQNTQVVNALMQQLPAEAVTPCLELLEKANAQSDAVSFEKHSMAVWFTMSRLMKILDEGQEDIDLSRGRLTVPNPAGYTFEASKDSDGTPVDRTITIIDDFTIFRDDKPFIYKAKFQPARRFGAIDRRENTETKNRRDEHNAYNDRNLVKKYQAAIEHGLIAGAAIEVRGLIDLKFLEWACGTNVFDPGAIPDVQIIYNLMLPSGAEYRFTLKEPSDPSKALSVTNDTHSFTLEDQDIVRGIESALKNPSQHEIYEIVSGTNVFNPTTSLNRYFNANAGVTYDKIDNPKIYDEYIRLIRQGVWDRARKIRPEIYNLNENTIFATANAGIENDRERMVEVVEDYQEYLRKNPEQARTKANYYLGEKDSDEYRANLERVIDVFAKNLNLIRGRELTRRHAKSYRALNQQRRDSGWDGPTEGVGLSLEHIMYDSIVEAMASQDNTGLKKGRSYENPERFMDIDGIMDYLERESDRQVFQIRQYDPKAPRDTAKKTRREDDPGLAKYANATFYKLQRLLKDQRRLNIKRALEYLEAKRKKPRSENAAWREARDDVYALKAELDRAKGDMQGVIRDTRQARKLNGNKDLAEDHPAMQAQAAHIDMIERLEENLWARLEPIFDVRTARAEFVRMSFSEENIMKFIYAINPDNRIVFDEEARGDGSGLRASHSELVGGQFCYGAGEMVFKRNAVEGRWYLKEINNGSGHYRPPTQSLAFAETIFIDELRGHFTRKGQDYHQATESIRTLVEKSRLTDAIARGRALRDHVIGPASKRTAEAGFPGSPLSPNGSPTFSSSASFRLKNM